MNVDDMILVSVDDHVIEPAHMFEGRVRKKYEDRAPRFVRRGDGTMAWRYEGHSDTTWPVAPETLMLSLIGVPDEEINAITHLNAMRHFSYDPFAHIPRERATVAALREQAADWDVSAKGVKHLRPETAATARAF